MKNEAHPPRRPTQRLTTRRLLARAAILFELLSPALSPPLGLIGLYLCVALLDWPQLLPPLLQVALLAGVIVGAAGLAWHALRAIRLPARRSADRRLETRSGLMHRPLAVLSDRPAGADALTEAVWRAHAARAAA